MARDTRLVVWYPAGSDAGCDIDIVFLHGLMGSTETTFTKNGVTWPRDLLKLDFPSARIFAFGYNADILAVFGRTAKTTITSNANDLLVGLAQARRETYQEERPITFVAHSLGGLIIKRLLSVSLGILCPPGASRLMIRKHAIAENTRGIIFAGTPHRGAAIADWGDWALSLAKTFGLSTNRRNVQALQIGAEATELLWQDFTAFRLQLQQVLSRREPPRVEPLIFTFVEELPYPGAGFIVTVASATIDIQTESVQIITGRDHRSMVKFESRNEAGYGKFVEAIKDIRDEIEREREAANNLREVQVWQEHQSPTWNLHWSQGRPVMGLSARPTASEQSYVETGSPSAPASDFSESFSPLPLSAPNDTPATMSGNLYGHYSQAAPMRQRRSSPSQALSLLPPPQQPRSIDPGGFPTRGSDVGSNYAGQLMRPQNLRHVHRSSSTSSRASGVSYHSIQSVFSEPIGSPGPSAQHLPSEHSDPALQPSWFPRSLVHTSNEFDQAVQCSAKGYSLMSRAKHNVELKEAAGWYQQAIEILCRLRDGSGAGHEAFDVRDLIDAYLGLVSCHRRLARSPHLDANTKLTNLDAGDTALAEATQLAREAGMHGLARRARVFTGLQAAQRAMVEGTRRDEPAARTRAAKEAAEAKLRNLQLELENTDEPPSQDLLGLVDKYLGMLRQ